MLGLNALFIALAPHSLGSSAGWLVVYGYLVCDLDFITSQAHLEAKRPGEAIVTASWRMNENI
jgi:hypothetical protein